MAGTAGWAVFDSARLKEKETGNCGVVPCGLLSHGFGAMASRVEGSPMSQKEGQR